MSVNETGEKLVSGVVHTGDKLVAQYLRGQN
jgi:hypothetical protein